MQLHHLDTSSSFSNFKLPKRTPRNHVPAEGRQEGGEGGREGGREGRKGGTYRRSMEMASWKASKTVAKISSFWEGGKEGGMGRDELLINENVFINTCLKLDHHQIVPSLPPSFLPFLPPYLVPIPHHVKVRITARAEYDREVVHHDDLS
jgi:hypothetical protein